MTLKDKLKLDSHGEEAVTDRTISNNPNKILIYFKNITFGKKNVDIFSGKYYATVNSKENMWDKKEKISSTRFICWNRERGNLLREVHVSPRSFSLKQHEEIRASKRVERERDVRIAETWLSITLRDARCAGQYLWEHIARNQAHRYPVCPAVSKGYLRCALYA